MLIRYDENAIKAIFQQGLFNNNCGKDVKEFRWFVIFAAPE
jgi:hypothetical protein